MEVACVDYAHVEGKDVARVKYTRAEMKEERAGEEQEERVLQACVQHARAENEKDALVDYARAEDNEDARV